MDIRKQVFSKESLSLGISLSGALTGKNAHLEPSKALEDLRLNISGRKILNTPYTIWQLLKHMNYWQVKFLGRLEGKPVKDDPSWQEGWEETLNAQTQDELDNEVQTLLKSIALTKKYLEDGFPVDYQDSTYDSSFQLVQSMASHLSYHLAEIILLRRIFGSWPPPSGGYVW